MKTIDFLKSVLGDNGLYCAWGFKGNKRVQQFYKTVEELETAAYEYDRDGYDIYYALATYKEAGEQKSPEMVLGREQSNVQEMRSFFLDLDCGEKKDYPSQEAAVGALEEFLAETCLPEPILVNSGNGVHVYWPLDNPVSREEWEPVANKLKRVCRRLGLRADPVRTSDAASILRIPATHNHKSSVPKEVVVVDEEVTEITSLEAFSSTLAPDEENKTNEGYTFGSTDAFAPHRSNKEYLFETIMHKTMDGVGCGQLGYIASYQSLIDEPLWVSGLSIAKHCKDAEYATKAISDEHPDYNEEVLQKKLEGISHRHTCITFDDRRPYVCGGCPHWGKIRSPLDLGEYIAEAEPEPDMPTYPAPYFRGKNGGVYKRVQDAEGNPEDLEIYKNDLFITKRLHDPDQGEIAVYKLKLPKDGVREFSVPLSSVSSTEEFRKHMSAQGVTAMGAGLKLLMEYSMRWVDELQTQGPADKAHQQFGWTDDTLEEFVLGDRLVVETDIKFSPPSAKTSGLVSAFVPAGTAERQKELFNFYNQDGFELHRFIIGMGFGTALMPMTGINSMLVHLFGGTGVGKTTAQMMALSVWGHPELLMNQRDDTYNSMMNRGEVLHNILLSMDEMTNITGLEFSKFVYQLSGGRQKNRLTVSGNQERTRGRPWELLSVSSANTSAWELLRQGKAEPKAEMQRLLEIDVPSMIKPDPKLKIVTDALFEDVKKNYGWFAEDYVQWIIANKETVRGLMQQARQRIDEAAGLTSENRFWSAGCSASMVGLLIASKLGIVDYPMDKQFDWIVDLLRKQRNTVNDIGASVTETMNDFIAEHWSNILHIRSSQDKRTDGVEEIVIPDFNPRSLVARYETDRRKLFIRPTPLREWCAKQQLNYAELVKSLKADMNAKSNVVVRFGKGTKFDIPPCKALELDFSIDSANESEST